jgi:phosphoglucomutase
MFGMEKPPSGHKMSATDVAAARARVSVSLDKMWDWLHSDAQRRAAS